MNLVSPKINRSRAVNRVSETSSVYSIQLYIQSFKIVHRGYVYFMWVSDNTQIQSLRYQSVGKTVEVKETLTISERIIIKNTREQTSTTFLKLIAADGQELDECEIPINSLVAQYKEMEIPMNRGLILLKARRKMMNISSEEEISNPISYRRRSKVQKFSEGNIMEIQSAQQQLGRIKKELQDEVYLNNKLKNDREVLMATKQDLELEIETMTEQISKEIYTLREHYQSRISIREHCYEEEIQDIVNVFNSSSEQTKKVVELILKQKLKLEEELKPLQERLKKNEIDQVDSAESYRRLENEKNQIERSLHEAEQAIIEKNQLIELLSGEKSSLQEQTDELKAHLSSLQGQIRRNQETISNQDSTLTSLQEKMHEIQFELNSKEMAIRQFQQNLQLSREKEEELGREKEVMLKEITLLQNEKNGYFQEIGTLKGRLQQFEYEMEFNQNVMNQLKKQQAQKQDQLYAQLQALQELYSKKIEEMLLNYQAEREQIESGHQGLQLQKQELERKLFEMEKTLYTSQNQLRDMSKEIENISGQLQSKIKNSEQKDKVITSLEKDMNKVKEQNQKIKMEVQRIQQERNNSSHKDGELNPSLEKYKQELLSKDQELRRMFEQVTTSQKQIQDLKEQKQLTQLQLQRITQAKSKRSRGPRSISGDKNDQFQQMPLEVTEVVAHKQQEIIELKGRVEQLQNIYHNIQSKMQAIANKYPEIDISLLDLNDLQNCDSQLQQERQINLQASTCRPMTSTNNAGPVSNQIPPINPTSRLRKRPTLEISFPIKEREQDIHSNSSVKLSHKKQYEARSESKMANSFQKNKQSEFLRQSLDVPKDHELKKQMSGSNRSQKSVNSYMKVSHTKKLKEFQDQIKDLLQRQKSYKDQIEEYEDNLNSLRMEMNSAKENLKNYTAKELKEIQANQKFLENKESQVLIEDARLIALSQENYAKEVEIEKTNYKIGQLEGTLNRERAEAEKKAALYQKTRAEIAKRQDQYLRKTQGFNDSLHQLQKQLAQMQDKLRKQKQSSQQAKLLNKQLAMHRQNDQNQLKKLRNLNETLEDKLQKLSGSESVIRQLSKEVSELEKKGLEQTRMINHIKLQKDAIEQELRMIKKRQNDQTRIAVQWEQKAAALQRVIEETKRKQNKLKREIQQGQEDVRRSKLQIKKLEEQLQAAGASQISWQAERRKHLDQISSLQDQLSRKQYELAKLGKQIEKWRLKSDEKDEVRMGRKSEMREEIDRLESELIRKEKKILEQTEENKLLRGRLQLLERQNKRIMEQRNQTYGEKLKYYVEQMSSIKKLLEEYQNQNNRLKIENNDLYEEAEIIRVNYDKMEAKYEDCMEREESILNDLQSYITQVNMLKDRLAQAHSELDQTEAAFANLRKESDDEKLSAKKASERMQAGERNLERALAQMRELKVRLSEFETNQQITGKIDEKYRQVNRRKEQLEEQCQRLKAQNENILSVFIYKRQNLEKAVSEAKNQEKRLREDQIESMREECTKAIANKTQRLQQEILQVYNDNTKLRAELQGLHEENNQQKAKIYDLQSILEKMGPVQSQYENAKNINQQLRGELRKKGDQISKMQISIDRAESQCKMKERQLGALRNRLQQLERINQKMNQEIKLRKNAERQLQQSLMKFNSNKDQQKEQQQHSYKQRQTRLIQQYQARINKYEMDLQKAKQKESQTIEQNAGKMKKLEVKMDEMESALKERQMAIQAHYEDQMGELQNSLLKTSQQLQQKLLRIEQLTNAIIALQAQNKNLNHELDELHYASEDEKQLHESQLTKLKNKLKQMETNYANNLKGFEEEISRASQVKSGNISGSRIKNNDLEERIAKRYEQKLKIKDRRIEELKDNIYTLQQTIVKLRKKENAYESTLVQIDRIKLSFTELEKERRQSQIKYEDQLNRNTNFIAELKKENLTIKQNQEKWRLILEEKSLEHQSMECELRTLRQLYQQLQKQLQKRKHIFTSQMEEENSLQGQLKLQQNRIMELQEQIIQKNTKTKELQQQCKRKIQENRKCFDAIEQYKKNEQKFRNQMTKIMTELTASKKTNEELNNSCESGKTQLRQVKNELARLKKNQEEMKINSLNREQNASELKKMNDQLSIRFREAEQAARRYGMLNERARKQLGFSIDEIIDRFIAGQEEREEQINQLFEEIEELKFLNQRKFLDFDELKKENLELQIKVEDLDILNDQVDTLRKICDKLEEEKKNTIFREEVLRMQMQNLANTGTAELRARIEYILANPPVPSYGSFSFYQK